MSETINFFDKIKVLLSTFDKQKIDVYIAYLKQLQDEKKDGKPVNWWFNKISELEYANAFKKVASTGLFIDGDSVTLNYRKKLVIIYDYHAYQNKVRLVYPESVFDFQLVHEGDKFSFKKESGKVIYSHEIGDPFNNDKVIKGAYGVIKNNKGEFIDFLNMEDIKKMKNTSLMKNIWDAWFDRMVLKSIIKRLCNMHFKDIVKEMDKIDNETNQPERALISEQLQKKIDEAKTQKELTTIFNENIDSVEDYESFVTILSNRKKEFKNG